MKLVYIVTFLVFMVTGCTVPCSSPEPIIEYRNVEVERVTVDCSWIKPIEISTDTAEALRVSMTRNIERDIDAILLHNTLVTLHCGEKK